jgi:hypothetical protein
MVDGDKRASGDLIEAFGVDAIPHLALVSAEGDVMTALIGPIPKTVLEADLDGTYLVTTRTNKHGAAVHTRACPISLCRTHAHPSFLLSSLRHTHLPTYLPTLVLISNAQLKDQALAQAIPYRMMDVFAGNPAGRRVQFDP